MPKKDFLNICLINVGSLGTGHDEFEAAFVRLSPDIIAINETWLRAGEEGRAPTLPGYRLRHVPRPQTVRQRGGGVGFYVRRGVRAVTVPHPPAPELVEQMWISLTVNSTRLVVGTAYRPPWLSCDIFFDALTESILSFASYHHVILLGDFNINMLAVSDNSNRLNLDDFFTCARIKNLVTTPTHFTNSTTTLIDLVCTDIDSDIVHNITVEHIPSLGGHAIVSTNFKIKKPKLPPRNITYRPLKQINFNHFNSHLETIDWNFILNESDVSRIVQMFSNFIIVIFDMYAPLKSITIRDKHKPWLTSNVRYMMQLRDQAHKKYHQSGSDSHKETYKDLKHLVNVSLLNEKKCYFETHVNGNINNPKKLWSTLKDIALPFSNKTVNAPDNFDNPNEINDYFLDIPGHNTCSISDLTFYEFHNHNHSTLILHPVDETTISKILLSLTSNAQGVDGIGLDMIFATLPYTLSTIAKIVNSSITSSTFPEFWKTAIVRPVPKTNSPSLVSDLRPISLLPTLSKVLEKVVYDQVIKFCEENHILPELQSGFRKSHSTSTALLDVVDNVLSAQDTGSGSIIALLDFSRAFDSININRLMSKLSYYGFDITCIKWFHSYLTNRQQRVRLEKSDGTTLESQDRHLVRGIPQGSIIGPLLFSIYSADIADCIKHCQYHIYADDLQVYTRVVPTEVDTCVLRINRDLDSIAQWAKRNCLTLNPLKSKYMFLGSKQQISKLSRADISLQMTGQEIERVTEARNLGVLMDGGLHFEKHIQKIVGNCFYRLKLLYRIRPYIGKELRIKLCEALVLSKLNYCTTVIGPCLLRRTQRLVQRVQNACARYCFHIPPRTHVTPFLNGANILKMETRRQLHLATLLFGLIKTHNPSYLYSKLTWRQSRHAQSIRAVTVPLSIPSHRTAAFRGSFRYAATKCWNNIPPPIRNCKSKSRFKVVYKAYLLELQKGIPV